MAITLGDILVYFDGDDSRLKRSFSENEARAKTFGSRVGSFLRDSMTHALGSVVADGFNRATQALGSFLANSASQAMDYQQSLNMIRASAKLMGESEADIDRLMVKAREIAIELGKDVSLPAATSADAALTINELVKGNLALSEAIVAARGSMLMATAGQMDFATAAQYTAGALATFNMRGEEAARVADIFAAAEGASLKPMSDFNMAVQQGGFMAAAAGVSFDKYITLVTQLTSKNMSGSDAGTALKNALLRLLAPTKEGAEAMRDYGISVYNAKGEFRDIRDIISQFNDKLRVGAKIQVAVGGATKEQGKQMAKLRKQSERYLEVINDETASAKRKQTAMKKLAKASAEYAEIQSKIVPAGYKTIEVTEQMRNKALETIFLSDGMKAFIPVLAEGVKGFDELNARINQNGSAQTLAAAKTKGTKGAFEALKSTVETIGQKLLEPFVGTDVKVGLFEVAIRGLMNYLGKIDVDRITGKIDRIIKILFGDPGESEMIARLKGLAVPPGLINDLERVNSLTNIDKLVALMSELGFSEETIKSVRDYAIEAERIGSIFSQGFSTGDVAGMLSKLGVDDETIRRLRELYEMATKTFGWLNENRDSVINSITGIVGAFLMFRSLSFIAGIVGGIVSAIAGIGATSAAAGGGLAGLVAVLGGPVTVTLGLVAAAAGLLYAAWTNNWGGIQEKTATATAWIEQRMSEFAEFVKAQWEIYGDDIKRIWNNALNEVLNIWERIKKGLQDSYELWSYAFSGDWRKFGEKLGKATGEFWNEIKRLFEEGGNQLRIQAGIIGASIVQKFRETDWSKVGSDIITAIGNGAASLDRWLRETFARIVANAIAAAMSAWEGFKAGFESTQPAPSPGAGSGATPGSGSGAGRPPPGQGRTGTARFAPASSPAGSREIVVNLNFNGVSINGFQDLREFADRLTPHVVRNIREAVA